MHAEIGRLLEIGGGVVDRRELLAGVSHGVLDHAIAVGHLVRILPRTYVEPQSASDAVVRRRAAVRYAAGWGAISHDSALSGWQLPTAETRAIHITTGPDHQLRGAPGLVVHRRNGFRVQSPWTVTRDGLPHVRLERALVESWPQRPVEDRRAPLILAVQRRLVTAERVLREADQLPKLGGRPALLSLVELLRAGCHSELEIWGHLHVFDHPTLPPGRRQVPVRVHGRTVYLDVAYHRELVDVELDGAEYHGPRLRRERDLRRDAALAALGWLTVRFSHARLHAEPEVIRRELRATLEVRRQQLQCG